jgi:hypothetical protein
MKAIYIRNVFKPTFDEFQSTSESTTRHRGQPALTTDWNALHLKKAYEETNMIEAKEETGLKDGDHPEHQPGVTAVPFDLLRVGDLSNSMKTTQLTSGIGARTRSRFAVDVIGDGPAGQQASCYYEVVGKTRQERPSRTAAGCRLPRP